MAAKSIKSLELHYAAVIQFLHVIINVTRSEIQNGDNGLAGLTRTRNSLKSTLRVDYR